MPKNKNLTITAFLAKWARPTKRRGTCSNGFAAMATALTDYTHEADNYDPSGGLLHWLHIAIGNAKAFVLGTYHGLPKENMQTYLDEFCCRFSRRYFEGDLFKRLTCAVAVPEFQAE